MATTAPKSTDKKAQRYILLDDIRKAADTTSALSVFSDFNDFEIL